MYEIVRTCAGKGIVHCPGALEVAIGNEVEEGKYVVWSNEFAEILYVCETLEEADSAQSCSGDYTSVVVLTK